MSSHTPLIVQGDQTLLLDVHDPGFEAARADIARFAELDKSPEHIHTYKITPLSLWNAASAGLDSYSITEVLDLYTRYPVPSHVYTAIEETMNRFGKISLEATEHEKFLFLAITEKPLQKELESHKKIAKLLLPAAGGMEAKDNGYYLHILNRGTLKQELIKVGYPVDDRAPLKEGEPMEFSLRDETLSGRNFNIRDYQREAAAAFNGDGKAGNGFGTIVLPCGAGKTIVGMTVMDLIKTNTLILTTNVAAVHQWMDELLDKSHLPEDAIGEYTGDRKEILPVTIATYQILVWRPDKESDYPHFDLFRQRNWGLIIYDEVHLLPAPMFRVTAEIQAVKRLGLTATLVREDGHEEDVFSLVGPKRYDVPWKELEAKGWIAEAQCVEVRVELPEELKIPYATADKRNKFRIASENPLKVSIARQIIENHPEDHILVIGQYLDQLHLLAKELNAPIITGKTPNKEREQIYSAFRKGEIRILVVSKVANFAIDLPDASVAIQVSGTFGSRQEEAQRLGRILRPKERNSFFYSILSRGTTEETFGANRQKFLTEQGYKYTIEIWDAAELS